MAGVRPILALIAVVGCAKRVVLAEAAAGPSPASEPRASASPRTAAPSDPPPDATRLCAGGLHACFVDDRRAVWCWGLSKALDEGQATRVPSIAGAVEVACGYDTACARTEAGRVFCWGEDETHAVGLAQEAVSVAVSTTGCAALADGSVVCWPDPESTERERIEVANAVQVAVGFYHACARTRTGDVHCWGGDGNGEIGTPNGVVTFASGEEFGDRWLGLTLRGGTQSCRFAQFWAATEGLENSAFRCLEEAGAAAIDGAHELRMKVGRKGTIDRISAGETALPADRMRAFLACFGPTLRKRGTIPHAERRPVDVSLMVHVDDGERMRRAVYLVLDDVVDLAASGYMNCAVRADGTTACWGMSSAWDGGGLIGTGFDALLGPVRIPGLDDAVGVTVGWRNQCVLHRDTSVSCYGANPARELGVGPDVDHGVVSRIEALDGHRALAIGPTSGCALDQAGSVWCFGSNDRGRLGIASDQGGVHPPTKVVGLPTYREATDAAQ